MTDPTKPKAKNKYEQAQQQPQQPNKYELAQQQPAYAEPPSTDFAPDHDILRYENIVTGAPDSTDLTTLGTGPDAKWQAEDMAMSGVGLAGLPGLAKSLVGVVKAGYPLAKAGGQLLGGNLTGAVKTFRGSPLSQALSGAQTAPAPAAAEVAGPKVASDLFAKAESWSTPEYLAAQKAAAGKQAWKAGADIISPPPAPLPTVSMEQGFKLAGAEASKRGSGLAMDKGLAALRPQPLTPVSMEQGFAAAGEAGRKASAGRVAMERGVDAAATTPKPTPLSMEEAFNAAGQAGARASAGREAMFKGVEAASKKRPLDLGLGAGLGVGLNDAQALQGLDMPAPAPLPPPLSNNATEAKQMGLQMLSTGQPRESLFAMLSQSYEPKTVEFVLAALPNRLPQ